MVNSSLAARLILTAAGWSAVALAVAAFVLVTLERQSVTRRFDERLGIHAKTIIGEISLADPATLSADDIKAVSEPRFNLPLHGWYWQIADKRDRTPLATSPSLVGEQLEFLPVGDAPPLIRSGFIDGPAERRLRSVEYDIVFEQRAFIVSVAADTVTVDREVAAFRNNLLTTFAVFALGLVVATLVQVRIGLRPLARLHDALGAIRIGQTERLEGDFPREIAPVVVELNALVAANSEIVERSRTQVGNLAHGLKTPLSVIINEARSMPTAEAAKIAEQADVMRNQIDLYLDRARIAAQRRVIGAVTDVDAVLVRLKRVMERLGADRGLVIELSMETGLQCRCEPQDAEEMLGNLLDNACKWARSRVVVRAGRIPSSTAEGRPMVTVTIEDDGPGLPADRRAEAMQRGRRLDENVPGTGLGLAIVKDLAALYGGEFTIGDGDLPGLRAELRLPALEPREMTRRPKFRHNHS